MPKFYLKKFLNAAHLVEVLDCEQKEILSPRGTNGICYEKFFYGIKTGEPDEISQQIEKMFQQMEDWIAKNLDRIILKILNNEQILDNEKWLISFLMSLLWVRGPVMRDQINAMTTKVMKKVNSLHFSHPKINEWFDQIDKNMEKSVSLEERERIKKIMIAGEYSLGLNNYFHLAMFDSFPGFANLFFYQHWTVFISKSKKFVTSDNPLVVIIPKRVGIYQPTFTERIHHFALTPEIFIVARYPETSVKKFKRKTLFAEQEQKILFLNLTIYDKAYKYLYATEKQSIDDILLLAKQYNTQN